LIKKRHGFQIFLLEQLPAVFLSQFFVLALCKTCIVLSESGSLFPSLLPPPLQFLDLETCERMPVIKVKRNLVSFLMSSLRAICDFLQGLLN